ncbi:ATP-binding protein [Devosia sp.]|uniref:HAMP domain-containing sensor histidine kinase n=1 Tax=Devosia sp. TaxID=1871048 RepID=UPI003A93F33B
MRLGDLTSASGFRYSLLVAPLFVLLLVGTAGYLDRVTQASMVEQLEIEIRIQLTSLRETFVRQGPEALRAAVQASALSTSPAVQRVGLFDAAGANLAGNVDVVPDIEGWDCFPLSAGNGLPDREFYGTVTAFGPTTLVMARTMSGVEAVHEELHWALMIAGAVIILTRLILEVAVSRHVGRKLRTLAKTLEAVSQGDTDRRVPVGKGNDQIDKISRLINVHLDRLSALMATTRNTIVSIAHDLRSPLNRASLSVQEAMTSEGIAPAPQASLEVAYDNLTQLSATFDTMLRISRIQASADHAGFEKLSLTELAADIAETFRPVAEDAGQSLTFVQDDDDSAVIMGDRRMLQQMLVNLVANASRYGPPGTTISIKAWTGPDDVVLEVADNGPGIPADQRQNVLNPFHRLKGGGHDEGAGLGLALVEAICTRHGASLTLSDNAPGLRVTICFHPATAGGA